MAVRIATHDPDDLLDAIKEAIDGDSIRSWEYDEDGDFTHTAQRWRSQAWFVAHVLEDELRFTIIPPKNAPVTEEVYAVFHGRFIEMLLAHFDHMFTFASATARPEAGDEVS